MSEQVVLPEGEYAIVELLGHRTLIGRIAEVERFGTKLLGIEMLFCGKLLPQTLHHGSAVYSLTMIDRETAIRRQATREWQLPVSLRASIEPAALPVPEGESAEEAETTDGDETEEPDEVDA